MPNPRQPKKTNKARKPKRTARKKPLSRSAKDLAHDTVLRMRQACEILYPIANGLGILRAPAASLEPVHRDTLEMIRTFCNQMEMHLDPEAPQGSIIDNLSLLVALVGAMEGEALPPFPEVVLLAQALSDSIIGGIVLPHTRGI